MTVDASAVLAIFLEEPDAADYASRFAEAGPSVMSAANYWEVLVRARVSRGADGEDIVARLLDDLAVSIEPADESLSRRAAIAFGRFRGRAGGRLNLGDSFAYALAEREGDGLLFKGDDFPKTDIKAAL